LKEGKEEKKEEKKKGYSLNLPVDSNDRMTCPTVSPIGGRALEYRTDRNVPLIPMIKQLQKTIDSLPVPAGNLWKQACSGDEVTNASWKEKWNHCLKENADKYNFSELSCFQFYNREKYKPVIIAGAGPSIRYNVKYLSKTVFTQMNLATGKDEEVLLGGRGDIRIVSCLHNFAFFEDNGIMSENDYYVNLDAGPITISEIYEGGKQKEEWYWEKTAERTLIATALSHPDLLKRWKGKIFFFKTGSTIVENYSEIVNPGKVPIFSVGGNVLGACLYFAKAILGAGPIIFIGADFCFSYDHKFHGWDSQYDSQFSGVIPAIDIYGNRVFTWPSYYNFKCFFDFISVGGMGKNSQIFINSTEGGILGAYPEGNIRHILQIPLKEVLHTFTMNNQIPSLMEKYNTSKQEIVLF
jgi:hypothetical protein